MRFIPGGGRNEATQRATQLPPEDVHPTETWIFSMSDPKNFLVKHFGPGCLAGITIFDWLSLLA